MLNIVRICRDETLASVVCIQGLEVLCRLAIVCKKQDASTTRGNGKNKSECLDTVPSH